MKSRHGQFNRLSRIADHLLDEEVGIIRFVKEAPREAGDPAFFHYYAQACNTASFHHQQNFGRAGGASSERGYALAKAIGEAIERYCSACYEADDFPLTSYKAAPFQCMPPNEFALYRDEQYAQIGFPYVPFRPDTVVRWTPTREIKTGEIWNVPASMVYLPYYFKQDDGEYPIVQPISTGLACHSSFSEAAISAICEVIERDAFTITWQARLQPPQINQKSLSEQNRDLVSRFERTGNVVSLFNITTDVGVATILAVSKGTHHEAPALVFAASSDLDPHRAARKSLEELAHTWQLARDLKNHLPPIVPIIEYTNVVHQDDHILLYCDHGNVSLADFLWASSKMIDFDDIPNLCSGNPDTDLGLLIQKGHSTGHRVLVADLTTPDVGELGLTVVRAVIPGFHPLCMGHRFRALSGIRLWSVPQKLGYCGITPSSGDNPAPHPYP